MHEAMAAYLYRAAAGLRGEETFRFLEEYGRTQWYSGDEWERHRRARFIDLYRYVTENIPFYMKGAGSRFADLPILDRKSLKEDPSRFVNPSLAGKRGITVKKTSGSTGEPVSVLRDAQGLAREQAVMWRGYGWAGVRPGARQARFWGMPLTRKANLITRGKDLVLNRKRFSVFNYTDETLDGYLAAFKGFSPSYVYGYVSALDDFARFLASRNERLRLPSLKAVISTSEVLDPEARHRIESAFGVRVFNEYGCSELGTIAHECEQGSLHVNSDTLHVEVIDEGGTIREEGRGRLLVTEFHNRVQPLVRYELGDIGEVVSGGCPCGRSMPIIREVCGKSYDIIYGPQGRKYFPEFFSYVFKDIQGGRERIRQFQLIQSDRDLIVNLVRGRDFDSGVQEEFLSRIRREFGGFFRCAFHVLERIPKEASGKFRQVKRLRPSEPFPALHSFEAWEEEAMTASPPSVAPGTREAAAFPENGNVRDAIRGGAGDVPEQPPREPEIPIEPKVAGQVKADTATG